MPLSTRPLSQNDAQILDSFLAPHSAEAYFLRSNAQVAGLTYHGKFLEAEYFGAFDNERMIGVVSYTWINSILAFGEEPSCLPALAEAIRPSIAKRGGKIAAVLGLAPPTRMPF